MYTSLKLLKESDACVPGFTKLLNFFGPKPDVKEQRIPLHVVSILGGKDDADWAIENGSVFDPVQFEAFRRRWLPVVFFKKVYTTWCGVGMHRQARQSQKLVAFYKKALTLFSYEEINEFLFEMSLQSHSVSAFKATFQSDVYRNPIALIQHVSGELDATLNSNSTCDPELKEYLRKVYLTCHGLPLDTPTQSYTKSKKKPVATTNTGWNEDAEDAEEEEDLSDDEDPDQVVAEDGGVDGPAVGIAVSKVEPTLEETRAIISEAVATKVVPHVLPINWRIFGGSASNPEHINFALALCPPGEDIYDFMRTMKYKLPRGAKVATASADGKLTVSVSGTKAMFAVVNALNSR